MKTLISSSKYNGICHLDAAHRGEALAFKHSPVLPLSAAALFTLILEIHFQASSMSSPLQQLHFPSTARDFCFLWLYLDERRPIGVDDRNEYTVQTMTETSS